MASNSTYRPSNEAIARYFAQESNTGERELIESWLKDDESNQKELDLLRAVWMDVGSLHPATVDVNTAAAFIKVKAKKDATSKDTPSSFWNAWKVAAVLALVASLLFLILNRQERPNEVYLSAEKVESVHLTDGSSVQVNAGSSLTYPENFIGDDRVVSLQGEAFFNIEPNPDQPFIVKVGNAQITVLGTRFNVNETTESIYVSVISGRVEVTSDYGKEILEAGEQVAISKSSQQLIRDLNSSSGKEQFWLTKKLSFQKTSMKEVISDLESAYQVTIDVSNESILKCKLQATFENQPIDEVLEIISISQELKVNQINDKYLLTGKGCDH